MKRSITSLLCGAAICAVIVPVSGMAAERNAGNVKRPVINERQHNQQERIRQGVKSGELTRAEAARLAAEQARIRASERRAKADGEITAAERARLQKALDKASQDIREQKHDDQDRN